MNGSRPDGRAARYFRRESGRAAPPGPLDGDRVAEIRETIVAGLLASGYTGGQVGQVIRLLERSIARILRRRRRRRELAEGSEGTA